MDAMTGPSPVHFSDLSCGIALTLLSIIVPAHLLPLTIHDAENLVELCALSQDDINTALDSLA
jgi:hypothetical protein